jgi:hypothetical protein
LADRGHRLAFTAAGAVAAWFRHLFRSQYPYVTSAQRRVALILAGLSLAMSLLLVLALLVLVPPLLQGRPCGSPPYRLAGSWPRREPTRVLRVLSTCRQSEPKLDTLDFLTRTSVRPKPSRCK